MIDSTRAYRRIEEQVALGPRFVGSPGHRAAQSLLGSYLAAANRVVEHTFEETFFGEALSGMNLWGHYAGEQPGRILLGTHYDTRPWADRDPDPRKRRQPVPGANDGASGVAILAELADLLVARRHRPSVDIIFLDAEDWHEIDGKEVSLGARHFVKDLDPAERPDLMVDIDMVAGKNLILDVDVNCQEHDESYALTLELFNLGRSLALPAFSMNKQHPYKWISDDHLPFMEVGIPSALLIDLDYPAWHTTRDIPAACDPASLAQVGKLCEAFIWGRR